MRRLLVLAACALVAAGCENKAPTTERATAQPRRLMKADGGAVPGAPVPGARQ